MAEPFLRANLRSANLAGVDLSEFDLSRIDLQAANLQRASPVNALVDSHAEFANFEDADAHNADFSITYLDGAILDRANCRWARFSGGLSDASLQGTDLRSASFKGSDLEGTNLRGAKLGGTSFVGCNLSSATGLEFCEHDGASHLDFATSRTSGALALGFLRGCGLPDVVIDYLPSLLQRAIEFYSCFISYSMRDQGFAERLHSDLQDKGIRCWFAPHDVRGGRKLHEQIDEAIRMYDRLLLILSEHSMNSEWVKTEIGKARQKEIKEQRRVLFPIGLVPFAKIRDWEAFDADMGKDAAREIREYFIPDFTKWTDNDAYRQALERVVRDLKAPAKALPPS